MSINIGIIGQGFVGNAVYQKFKSFFNVFTYDLKKELCNSSYDHILENCNIIFLCLPTPMEKNGSCYLGILENQLDNINKNTSATVIIKSTIPPNTTNFFSSKYKNLNIFFNPEFLTEANAVKDFENQKRIIIGGEKQNSDVVLNLFKTAFPVADIILIDSSEAEMVKYFTNIFLATKVSFSNEFYNLCKILNINFDNVIDLVKKDDRIGKSHFLVPGPDGDFGYGGHCFPKDIAAILYLSEKLGSTNYLMKAVVQTNDEVRKNRDWEKMKGRAIN
tara:strand:+ start:5415 stop:6242 length:828 start_codon:yes stop_codon:yes gene_type:complete